MRAVTRTAGALIAAFVYVLLLQPAEAFAATIKDVDKQVKLLKDTCLDDVEDLLPSSAAEEREDYDSVERLADQCGAVSLQISNHFARLGKPMKDNENRSFISNVNRNADAYIKKVIAGTRPVRDAANRESNPKDELDDLADELEKFFDLYDKLKVDITKRYNVLEREAEKVSKAWNDERSDDEDEYKIAVDKLDDYLGREVAVLKRGAELVSKAGQASREWAEANRSGDQDEIEEAYKQYFSTHNDLEKWMSKYDRTFDLYEKIPVRAAWKNFIEETKKSFKLYDGKVSVSNMRLHEYGVHVMGY